MGVPRGYKYAVSKSYGIDKIKDSRVKDSFVLKESNQTISRSEAYAELNAMNALNTSVIQLRNQKGKMFFQISYDQKEANRLVKDENYVERLRVIKLIVSNPSNQSRWNYIDLLQTLESEEKNRLESLDEKNIYGYGEIWFTAQESVLREIQIQKNLDEEKALKEAILAKQKIVKEREIAEEKRLIELEKKSQELESFYELQEIKKSEKIEPTENKEIEKTIPVPITENKEIALETTAPILAVLGIGLVSYYLLKGNKK
tara:strand:- start:795 stop:1571 length:777 start_codon:yes stop_codon:yes gene_type:complete